MIYRTNPRISGCSFTHQVKTFPLPGEDGGDIKLQNNFLTKGRGILTGELP
jgi:hypothetical protein